MSAPVRPPALRRADKTAAVVSAVVAALAGAGVLARLGLDVEQAVAIVGGVFAVVAWIRGQLEDKNEQRVHGLLEQAQAEAFAAGVERGRAPVVYEETPTAA